METLGYMAAGYIAIWLLIGGYVIRLGMKTSELSKKVDMLAEMKKEG